MISCYLHHGGHIGKGCNSAARNSKSLHSAPRDTLAHEGASLRIVGTAAEHEIASVRGCFMGMLLAERDWRKTEILNN
jgi:hypothetical protein